MPGEEIGEEVHPNVGPHSSSQVLPVPAWPPYGVLRVCVRSRTCNAKGELMK